MAEPAHVVTGPARKPRRIVQTLWHPKLQQCPCGLWFLPNRSTAQYCSHTCQDASRRARLRG